MGYRRVDRVMAFDLGIGVHLALAYYYESIRLGKPKNPVKFFTAWADEQIDALTKADDGADIGVMAEVRTFGTTMLEGYVEEYHRKERLDVIAVEKEVARELPGTDWTIQVRIDAVVVDRSKSVEEAWVLEHKTFTQLAEDYLEKDTQFAFEVWCAQELTDLPIAGLIYNGLRKMIPGPRVKNPLFVRRHLYVNEHQIATAQKRARGMYNDLTRGKLSIYPEPNPIRCNMCPFKEPCTAYQKGEDYQYILDHSFAKRKEEA